MRSLVRTLSLTLLVLGESYGVASADRASTEFTRPHPVHNGKGEKVGSTTIVLFRGRLVDKTVFRDGTTKIAADVVQITDFGAETPAVKAGITRRTQYFDGSGRVILHYADGRRLKFANPREVPKADKQAISATFDALEK
jgi:hypothetical protein